MERVTDRTLEIEQRLSAIRIGTRDTCAFFKQREGATVSLKECWYCAWGAFPNSEGGLYAQGVCQFKRAGNGTK